ncbi:MAG: acyl-CoA thioesterase II [Litoreibacter sp.]|nr:acyl-CoA thioesterase II [Litoreibacter sp.]
MTDPVQTLLDLLSIERLEQDLFRGIGSGGETSKRIFGGQVVAQALAAAYHTVEDRACHSLHAYFLRPGDPSIPVIYEVDRARDGGSFTTRRVIAIQHGRQIFNMAASFHAEEDSPSHQHDMPDAPAPEGLEDRLERRAAMVDRVPEERRKDFLRPSPIEVREVEPVDPLDPQVSSDRHSLWFRVARPVDGPAWLHQCLLTYASDMYLLSSAMRPHGESYMSGRVMTASLDHAVWFHRPARFDEWHLYTMDSPFSGGARGFNRGAIYSSDGALVASTAQEGLTRPLRK